ncbi:MAG: hypothetical protein Q8N16_00990 [bacterium]|nr:hypothetical protein [bacterium]
MKRQLWFLGRFAAYFTMNLLWPIVLMPLRVAKKLGRPVFRFIFLVYPGTLDQVRGYAPLWYREIAPMISVIGVIKGRYPGLVVTIPRTIEEMEDAGHRHQRLERMVKEVKSLADAIGAKAVALAGRLPSVLLQNGYSSLPAPIVAGNMGSTYTVVAVTQQAIADAGLSPEQVKIGVLGGYGYLGSRVVNTLKETWKVVAIDPRADKRRARDPAAVSGCNVVVVLTARGEQMETVIDHLDNGVIVVDDTHPQLPKRLVAAIKRKEGRVIKATLTLKGSIFMPRLPKWKPTWLPGCCVEAIVIAADNAKIDDQQRFNNAARMLGFTAPIVEHQSEL